MKLLAIDRSTDTLSVALAKDGEIAVRAYGGADARNADWPAKIRGFLAENGLEFSGLDRIVIGTGPGSFAGIRGALAFAQGLSAGIRSRRADLAGEPVVYGLPSPMALARESGPVAVVGDARRGLFWVVVYDGAKTVSDFGLVRKDALAAAVPENACVATSDGARIGEVLWEIFGERYSGSMPPSAGALVRIALGDPERLVPEPLPVYLSPAVRV
jgi:tRNA threonylcarbamoyl adenosine modification protein YeaZ